MKHLIIAGTIALVAGMLVGPHVNSDALFAELWSSTLEYDIVRVILIATLLGLVFSKPPRSTSFRALLGVMAGILVASAAAMLLQYQMKLLDVVVFVQVAIIFLIEAAETSPHDEVTFKKQHLAPQV
jgi:hypothetical protein